MVSVHCEERHRNLLLGKPLPKLSPNPHVVDDTNVPRLVSKAIQASVFRSDQEALDTDIAKGVGGIERELSIAAEHKRAKNRLNASGLALSGGQAQRLCIARTIAVEPDVVLMDEPASALDPIATGAVEDLMVELKQQYTIVVVTHNMQQATRVSDRTAFFYVLTDTKSDTRTGVLVEYGRTEQIFQDPQDSRTKAYVTGRMG